MPATPITSLAQVSQLWKLVLYVNDANAQKGVSEVYVVGASADVPGATTLYASSTPPDVSTSAVWDPQPLRK